MARLIRKNERPVSRGGLTADQRFYLITGMCLSDGFDNPTEYESAWFAHRAELLGQCKPFERPEAYWIFAQFIPECRKNNYETQRNALLRLGLPLTEYELAILRREAEQAPAAAPVAAPQAR